MLPLYRRHFRPSQGYPGPWKSNATLHRSLRAQFHLFRKPKTEPYHFLMPSSLHNTPLLKPQCTKNPQILDSAWTEIVSALHATYAPPSQHSSGLLHCSTWRYVHSELKRLSQILTNNGYNSSIVNRIIQKHKVKWYTKENSSTGRNQNTIKLNYKNHMSIDCTTYKNVLKDIIGKYIRQTNPTKRIQFATYVLPNKKNISICDTKAPKHIDNTLVREPSCVPIHLRGLRASLLHQQKNQIN